MNHAAEIVNTRNMFDTFLFMFKKKKGDKKQARSQGVHVHVHPTHSPFQKKREENEVLSYR